MPSTTNSSIHPSIHPSIHQQSIFPAHPQIYPSIHPHLSYAVAQDLVGSNSHHPYTHKATGHIYLYLLQIICMECQTLFSKKRTKIKCHLLQFSPACKALSKKMYNHCDNIQSIPNLLVILCYHGNILTPQKCWYPYDNTTCIVFEYATRHLKNV